MRSVEEYDEDKAAAAIARLLASRDRGAELVQGAVVSYNAGTKRAVVTLAGSSTQVSNVRHFAFYTPVALDTIWLLRQGRFVLILGKLA